MRFARAADVLAVAFVLVVAGAFVAAAHDGVDSVRSGVDGRAYVVRALPDRQAAADALARVAAKLQTLVNAMAERYPDDADVARLRARFRADAIQEAGSAAYGTSYTLNKTRIVLCLRSRDAATRGALTDDNTVTFVAVHELAHVMTAATSTREHTPEFWRNFRRLLREAVRLGLYTDVDYAAHPVPYCGIVIDQSVLHGPLPRDDGEAPLHGEPL
jgi:hypothetical protein